MKHCITATVLLLTGFAHGQVHADDAGLARCAQISEPSQRLTCYDALAGAAGHARSAAVAAAAPVAQTPVVQTPAAPPPEPPAVDSMDNFGFEKKKLKTSHVELVARYEGEFTGWSGGTLFKLDNGQVWKQAQSGRVFHRRENPQITIRKGALGSFRLSVEGTNRTVRVKRVK